MAKAAKIMAAIGPPKMPPRITAEIKTNENMKPLLIIRPICVIYEFVLLCIPAFYLTKLYGQDLCRCLRSTLHKPLRPSSLREAFCIQLSKKQMPI